MFSLTGCGLAHYYYEAIRINIYEPSSYSFYGNSSMLISAYIYENEFNPLYPEIGMIYWTDQIYNNKQFYCKNFRHWNTTYILVITTLNPNVTALFSILITGPSKANVNRISEYLYY